MIRTRGIRIYLLSLGSSVYVCIILVRCYKFVTFYTHTHIPRYCLWKLQHMNFWNQNFIFFNKLLNFHKRQNSFIFLLQNLPSKMRMRENSCLAIIIIKKNIKYHFMNTLLLLFSKCTYLWDAIHLCIDATTNTHTHTTHIPTIPLLVTCI